MKIFRPKHQKRDKNNTLEDCINELIEFLISQVTNLKKAKGLLDDAERIGIADNLQKIAELPSFYLSFEHFLTEIDDNKSFSVEVLRYNVGKEFPGLLKLESFNVIFKSVDLQEVILCKLFLIQLLEGFSNIFGQKKGSWLKEIIDTLENIPNMDKVNYPLFENTKTINGLEDWIPLLKSVSNSLSNKIESKIGEQLTQRVFEKTFTNIANTYKYLEGFPAIVTIIPERFLNSEKIGILSKHQIGKVLLKKTRNLEKLNKELADNNKTLEKTKKALEDSNDKLEATLLQFSTVLNTVNKGILMANESGEIVMINRTIKELFGYTEAELIGQSLTIIMPEKHRAAHTKGIKRHLSTGISKMLNKPFQVDALGKNSQMFPVEIIISRGSINNQIIFTAAIKDITKQVEMEKALLESNERLEIKVKERTEQLTNTQLELEYLIKDLERSNKELEEFGYMVSHDLQEPLRTISSYLQLLKGRFPETLDDTAQEFLKFAVDGSTRMKRLINDLLEYSRAGRGGVKANDFNISDVEKTLKSMFKTRLEETGGEIIFHGVKSIFADETQITQLLQNLIGNAIKFQKSGTKPIVDIEITAQEKEWLFAVKDNGIGIEKAFQDKIFTVFQRLHNRNEYEGTGIGLAICKKIVDIHKGKIWIESEVNIGTTFFFTISKDLS